MQFLIVHYFTIEMLCSNSGNSSLQRMRNSTFCRPIFKYQADRYQCHRPRQISTYGMCCTRVDNIYLLHRSAFFILTICFLTSNFTCFFSCQLRTALFVAQWSDMYSYLPMKWIPSFYKMLLGKRLLYLLDKKRLHEEPSTPILLLLYILLE